MRQRSLLVIGLLFAPCALGFDARAEKPPELRIASDAFEDGKPIPRKFTCDGADRSPPIHWEGVPEGTNALALVVDDPDAPSGTWTHWLLYNMPPATRALGEGVPTSATLGDGSRQGTNDFGKLGYGGPCPPPGATHRYRFKLYALSGPIELEPGAKRDAVLQAIGRLKIVAEGELVGGYGR
jgi:Raf kinase inhibitor-like YbhB/YbcL family protein